MEMASDSGGHLELRENPEAWIEYNPASISLLTSLRLNLFLKHDMVEEIGESIGELTQLIRLEFWRCTSLKCVPNTITRLHNLKHLIFFKCGCLEELPANIGQLVSLTYLNLFECKKIKYLPNSIANLSNLTFLSLSSCHSLVELPANIGQLVSLIHLELCFCHNIKSLPTSVGNLPNLTHLTISSNHLFEIPSDLGHLKSLTHLYLSHCGWDELLAIVCQLRSLTHLCLSYCMNIKSLPKSIANLSNLTSLTLSYRSLVELPPHLDGLSHLCLLDIQHSEIRCLPWSIMNLPKLRHLMLPTQFRLQTLPYELNDLVVISVKDRHFRKSWEELKKEMGRFPIPLIEEIAYDSTQSLSIISPPGYLRLKEDPRQWIIDNRNLLKLVRVLDLEPVLWLTNSITKFSKLTHLYLYSTCGIYLWDNYFVTLTGITHLHLSLHLYKFDKMSIIHGLSKLTNLETLHLNLRNSEIPTDNFMPVSLKHLSLEGCDMRLLYDSLKKLLNLKTLDLYHCDYCNSFPYLNLDKLKLCDCFFKSLSIGVRQLEILFSSHFYESSGCFLEKCLNQLVNLETLSITCFDMKFLPEEIARLRTLKILQLKDCVNLKTLPSNLHELFNLHTLDISITKIMSLPPSFVKPRNLTKLILPKCFNLESFPRNLKQVSIIDDTEETYYKSMEYDASLYQTSTDISDESKDKETEQRVAPGEICNEGNDIVPIWRIDEIIPAQQTSADPFNGITSADILQTYVLPLEEITSEEGVVSQTYKDSHLNCSKDTIDEHRQHTAFSSQTQFTPLGNGKFVTNLPVTYSFGVNNQHVIIDGQTGNKTSENAREIAPISQHISSCDGYNFINGLNNCHALEFVHSNNNSQSCDVDAVRNENENTPEPIQEKLPTIVGLINAAEKLYGYNLPKEMPDNINVMNRRLKYYCSMQFPPRCLGKSEHLKISLCIFSEELLANLKNSMSLKYLAIQDCSQHHVKKFHTNFSGLANLKTLSIRCIHVDSLPSFTGLSSLLKLYIGGVSSLTPRLEKLPADLDKLAKLLVVDIHDTKIKCLPWSIKKLQKLRFLFLPMDFRLETLPCRLIEFVVITVDCKHIRKTWTELKTEMGLLLFHGVGVDEAQSSAISSSGYLQLKEDPGIWIMKNSDLCLSVRSLELEVPVNMLKIGESIKELRKLTYLYISGNIYLELKHLSGISNTLRHLSLQHCNIKSHSDCLEKLSNLESLCLDLQNANLPDNLDLLVNLRHLTLLHGKEQSDFANISKLSGLKALDLFQCELESLPENLNLAELKLSDSNIRSLPTSLQCLEILHDKETCERTECDVTSLNLKMLINMEKLSITCYSMELLPSIEKLRNLQELQLKDCFSLEALPNNLGELVKLCTLDISGTGIKSLHDSITSKLHNLKKLILPKCFEQDDIRNRKYPRKEFTKVSIDKIVELYFNDMSDDDETSNEGNEIELEGSNEAFSKGFEEGNINAQPSPHGLHVTPFIGDFHSNRRENSMPEVAIQNDFTTMETEQGNCENEQNYILQNDIKGMKRKEISLEMIQSFWSKNMTLEEAAEEIRVSRSTMKRKLKDLKLVWPSRRKGKQHLDAKKRKHNNRAPFESDCSHQNLVIPGNSAAHTKTTVGDCITGADLHISSNSNAATNSIPDTTMVATRDDVVTTQCDMDCHQRAQDQFN